MNMLKLGGRKFILTVGCGLVTSILLWFDKLAGSEYATVILGTVAVYIAGGTYENVKGPRPPGKEAT
jgi:hypothetical protein